MGQAAQGRLKGAVGPWILLLLLISLLAAGPAFSAKKSPRPLSKVVAARPIEATSHPLDQVLDGPPSDYVAVLNQIAKEWPPRGPAQELLGPEPIHVSSIETSGRALYVGTVKAAVFEAPLSAIEAVLDGFDRYRELFPEFNDIHVVSRDGNWVKTSWERRIPVFFLPNVTVETNYLIDKSHPTRTFYRYQLSKSSNLKNSDGLIVLESLGPDRTRYRTYEFFEADWGPISVFGQAKIWRDCVQGAYLSDLALKFRAEHPDWSIARVHAEKDLHAGELNAQAIYDRRVTVKRATEIAPKILKGEIR